DEPAQPRHLAGGDDPAVDLADQDLLVRRRGDLAKRRPLVLGHTGRLLEPADGVLPEQGEDGLQVGLPGLPDPHHPGLHATTKTRRNGSTVPHSRAGYASRRAALYRRTKSSRRP